MKLVDEYRFLDPTAPPPAIVCGMCMNAPVKVAGTLCGLCKDTMSVKSIKAAMEETAAERIDWPGYNADGEWYAPIDRDLVDLHEPTPAEDRMMVGVLICVPLVLLSAIAWCLHHLNAIHGWHWWAFVLAPSVVVFVCIGVAITINCWIGGRQWKN